MTKVETAFFELLKMGLWDISSNCDIFRDLSDTEWKDIYNISSKQTVMGITYDGIAKLPMEYRPDKKLLLQWSLFAIRIEQNNLLINTILTEVIKKYQAQKLSPVLLKGQGIGQYYPNPKHRQPGDIDLYFDSNENYQQANHIASKWDDVVLDEETSKHQSFSYKNVIIENHHTYFEFYNKKNIDAWKHVMKYLPLCDNDFFQCEGCKVAVPSPQMNAVYTFLHLFHHFLTIGVGLRQVCDWMCLLNAHAEDINIRLFERTINDLPISRGMGALKYIAVHYLGFPRAETIPIDINSDQTKRDAELMIEDIMASGNFAHDTEMMRIRKHGFVKNLHSYTLAMKRYIKIYPLCKSEVIAYPLYWVKSKIHGY
jgi:hypothetical protein